MISDPNTRQSVANRPAPGAERDGSVFRLVLSANTQVAEAPLSYEGIHWVQIPWPIFGDSDVIAVTLMHESFHVVQPSLGFYGNADNGTISGDADLDTEAGRVWLRGELHALKTALLTHGQARSSAVRDAVAMRLYRYSLLPNARKREQQLDVLEGLAEGTGIDAGLPANRRSAYAIRDIAYVERQPSYARSFPYGTGPAYTELLDAAKPNWRRFVKPGTDIAIMTMRAYGLNVASPTAARARAIIQAYGGKAIFAQEATRAARKAALDAKYKRELVYGETLTLPMTAGFHITFNPRDIESLGPYGTVYHTLTLSDRWGVLSVSGGDAIISKDFRTVCVVAPKNASGNAVKGDGWSLQLSNGYTLLPRRQKPGSYVVSAAH